MGWFGEAFRRIRFRFRREEFDRDLAEEMRLHVEMLAEEKSAAGIARPQAEVAARRQFGNQTLLRESSGEAWGWRFLDTLKQDVRYALRTLRANPGFTVTAVLSLALGIGANTAIFSIINAVMLRHLPVQEPERLVSLMPKDAHEGYYTNPIWEQVRDHQKAFSGALAYSPGRFDLAKGGESHFVRGIWVSGDFFYVLGVPSWRGRVFSSEDDQHGGGRNGPVAVISYEFWLRHFLGDENVIGKTVSLNRHEFVIVGVTPPEFRGLQVDRGFDVAIPIGCEPILNPDRPALDSRSTWWLQIVGRLRDGQTIQQAEAQMQAMAPEVFRATLPPNWNAQDQKEYLTGTFALKSAATGFSDMALRHRTALMSLMAIVGLVLLISCANIANLLLARGVARQREFSVRLAIGASRRRVVRQLMTESILLSSAGAVFGLVIAMWAGRFLVRLLSTRDAVIHVDLRMDTHLLLFTIGVSLLTALLFGLLPAWRSTRLELNQVLKDTSSGTMGGTARFRFGRSLVAGQVALTLVLLVGAGLFLRTFEKLATLEPGFIRKGLLVVNASGRLAPIPKEKRSMVYQEILERIQAMPGVGSAASSMVVPIGNMAWNELTEPEGYTAKSRDDTVVYMNRVSPGYFGTMGTPMLRGRDFDERDNNNSGKVMVITEYTAKSFFGDADPIGKTIRIEKLGNPNEKDTFEVIGVVKDGKYATLYEKPKKLGYMAMAQDTDPWGEVNYEIRPSLSAAALVPSLRAAVAQVNRDLSLDIFEFELLLDDSLMQQRVVALLSVLFGSLAVVLSMIGLYGLTAYSVAQRKAEIGVRMALGARPQSVVWLVFRDVIVLLGIGTAVGVVASLALGPLVANLLYGVRPNDPWQVAGAALVLVLGATVAASVPARRAARLDPMEALREG